MNDRFTWGIVAFFILAAVAVSGVALLADDANGITAEDMSGYIAPNETNQAFRGSVPGVNVVEMSGHPGEVSRVRIRGGSSSPWFVVDGMAMENRSFGTVCPEDIEKITILKGASTTSLYGSHGFSNVKVIKGGNPISNALVPVAEKWNSSEPRIMTLFASDFLSAINDRVIRDWTIPAYVREYVPFQMADKGILEIPIYAAVPAYMDELSKADKGILEIPIYAAVPAYIADEKDLIDVPIPSVPDELCGEGAPSLADRNDLGFMPVYEGHHFAQEYGWAVPLIMLGHHLNVNVFGEFSAL